MNFTVDIKGAEELSKVFDELPREVRNKIMMGALRAGGNIVRTSYRRRIPIRQATGSAEAKRISKRSPAYRLPGFGRASVIVVKKRGEENAVETGASRRAFYLRILELGSRYISPRGWLRQAFAESEAPVLAKIGGMIWVGIERWVARQPGGKE